MKRLWSQFLLDESGATAIEYGMIAGMIALVVIGSVNQLGATVRVLMYELTANAMTNP